MAWRDIPVTPPVHQAEEPLLRIFNQRQGYLNLAARAFLFGGEKSGLVRFQENGDARGLCIIAVDEDGQVVSRTGRITVSPVTARAGGTTPVTLRLQPVADNGVRRLILAGVAQ